MPKKSISNNYTNKNSHTKREIKINRILEYSNSTNGQSESLIAKFQLTKTQTATRMKRTKISIKRAYFVFN